ncbi:MAG: Oxidoreductase, 2OG-Fe(II) oxygenase family [Herbaspirillum sp.]|jgi:isopenicillin N synthase-like dioxygenase|nr:Oxidoreductase, 2OG-Fe(II) oxygenase family [Herbaspirillum sp.]
MPADPQLSRIPVIDIARLRGGGADDIAQTAAELGQACREIGFFYISGHGLSEADADLLMGSAAQFFSRPPDWKKQYSIERSAHNRGYVALMGESLDPQHTDIKEAFNIGLELAPDDPELLAGVPFRGMNIWPDIAGWRDTMLHYFGRMREINLLLHKAVAVDLGLAPDFFDSKFSKPLSTLRLLRYPPQAQDRKELGAGVHTDYGNLTVLLQKVGGLQVQALSGEWLDAPVMPGCLVCNIGDCLMRWSNDVYRSTPHRVVNQSGGERYSVAFFSDPNPEALVACLPTCVSADRPVRYEPISSGAYLAERLNATYKFRQ